MYYCFKVKFRSQSQKVIDHRLLLPQSSFSTFAFELPPHPSGSSVPVYHLLARCNGTCVEDWMGLDIAVRAVGKVSTVHVNLGFCSFCHMTKAP